MLLNAHTSPATDVLRALHCCRGQEWDSVKRELMLGWRRSVAVVDVSVTNRKARNTMNKLRRCMSLKKLLLILEPLVNACSVDKELANLVLWCEATLKPLIARVVPELIPRKNNPVESDDTNCVVMAMDIISRLVLIGVDPGVCMDGVLALNDGGDSHE